MAHAPIEELPRHLAADTFVAPMPGMRNVTIYTALVKGYGGRDLAAYRAVFKEGEYLGQSMQAEWTAAHGQKLRKTEALRVFPDLAELIENHWRH